MSNLVARGIRCVALLLVVISTAACKSSSGATGGSGGAGGAGGGTGGKAGGEMDAGGCKAPNVLLFTKPGCGSDVMPSCVTGNAGACATIACGCDGQKLYGPCNGLPQRFTDFGACLQSGADSGL